MDDPFAKFNTDFNDVSRLIRILEKTVHRDMRLEVLAFEGKLDPDAFVDLLDTIEKVFECKGYRGIKCVRLVVTTLSGHAKVRWNGLCQRRRERKKEATIMWGKMKKCLPTILFPPTYMSVIYSLAYRHYDKI